jgi:hypothetical protein
VTKSLQTRERPYPKSEDVLSAYVLSDHVRMEIMFGLTPDSLVAIWFDLIEESLDVGDGLDNGGWGLVAADRIGIAECSLQSDDLILQTTHVSEFDAVSTRTDFVGSDSRVRVFHL